MHVRARVALVLVVPTPNNPDVNPATTCAARLADNDQFDDQVQSPAGTADNAVTLAGCSYDPVPFEGPSTESRPAVFQVDSGPGGLLCGQGLEQRQVCALPGINYPAGQEYRVVANNESGANATGTTQITFCADDPPATGVCGPEDEQVERYQIDWEAPPAGGGQPGGGGGAGDQAAEPCRPPACIPAGGTPTASAGNRTFTAQVVIPTCDTRRVTARIRITRRTVSGKVVTRVRKIVFRLDRGRRRTDRRPPYRKTFSLLNAAPGSLHTLRARVVLTVKRGTRRAEKRTLRLSKRFRVCPGA